MGLFCYRPGWPQGGCPLVVPKPTMLYHGRSARSWFSIRVSRSGMAFCHRSPEGPSHLLTWVRWVGDGRKQKISEELRPLIIPKEGNTMIKAGDMFKNIESGRIFTVKSVDPRTIILGTKDGFQSMFVNPNNMESVFVPFVEDEVKGKLKE